MRGWLFFIIKIHTFLISGFYDHSCFPLPQSLLSRFFPPRQFIQKRCRLDFHMTTLPLASKLIFPAIMRVQNQLHSVHENCLKRENLLRASRLGSRTITFYFPRHCLGQTTQSTSLRLRESCVESRNTCFELRLWHSPPPLPQCVACFGTGVVSHSPPGWEGLIRRGDGRPAAINTGGGRSWSRARKDPTSWQRPAMFP